MSHEFPKLPNCLRTWRLLCRLDILCHPIAGARGLPAPPAACLVFPLQIGESEVPSYLVPDDPTEPASVVPAQPAANGEQVDEFGLPIAPTPAAAT